MKQLTKKQKIFVPLIKWLSGFDWIYKISITILCNRIVHNETTLTPEYLIERGWEFDGRYCTEPDIKSRNKIWIEFEHHYYRVWHGRDRTFIALNDSLAWFETYYLLVNNRDEIYEKAGI